MSFLAINDNEINGYIDVDFIEEMDRIHRRDFSFEPIQAINLKATQQHDRLAKKLWSPCGTISSRNKTFFDFKPIQDFYQNLEIEAKGTI